VVLQDDLDAMDADILKPKKKSATFTAAPAFKPDPAPLKTEHPSTKPKGELNIS